MRKICLNKEVFHRKWICFLSVSMLTCLAYGQAEKERFDLPEKYPIRLAEHLSPNIDTLIDNQMALFYGKPSFEPEYSIRIVERGDQSYIEGRFLEKNLWYELFDRFRKQDKEHFSVNVSLYSMPIGIEFKNKMLEAYSTVIHGTKTVDDCSFDGITYVFTLFHENERAGSLETHSPKPGAIEYDMANLFTQIANDLKSQSFDEEKYMPVLKSF